MNSAGNKPLLILNASAGSGKTYNLVKNYLRLLLQEGEGKAELNQILAMTFTNKASIEMKTRIIQDLDRLAYGELQNDRAFRSETAQFIGSTADKIQFQARQVLKRILHQYEDFNVSTIDKFNLKLIRSFARDLDLPDNFEIVINDTLVLNRAIDQLMDLIDNTQQTKLYDLAMRFVRSRIEYEDSWDIKKLLATHSKYLTNERYFEAIKKLTENDLKEETFKSWKEAYNTEFLIVRSKLNLLYEQFISLNLTENHFHYKKNTYNRVKKLLSMALAERFELSELVVEIPDKFMEYLETTVNKKMETELTPHLIGFLEQAMQNAERWKIEELKINQFHFLAILKELALLMEDIRKQDAVIRVSEFNQLVANLVQNEDAPFIYERLGSRYKHFFLDEFQDTSRLQWLNLVPLVHNSIAENHFNFIVGDPKQSIYRFKNGVAEQFVALPTIYNPEQDPRIQEKSTFFTAMGQVESLEDNWRSATEIVAFNNRFFEAYKSQFPAFGQSYYQFVSQQTKGKTGGYVEINLELKNDEGEDQELENLEKWVQLALENGYSPADICVLSKKTASCNKFALFLKSKGYHVVSSDSLRVDSDETVQMIIEFLRWKSDPESEQLQMQFGYRLLSYFKAEKGYEIYKSSFETLNEGNSTKRIFRLERLLNDLCLDKTDLYNLTFQNIYTLITGFMRFLKIDPLENAYLYQLLDIAYKFDNSNGPILLDFLKFYDDQGKKTNVVLPETRNSIQVMTAHKSKGLEFPIVIIPSINFQDDNWHSKESRLIAPDESVISASLTAKNQIIPEVKRLYNEEKENVFMDSINLLYVAFTRAVDGLFVGSVYSNRNSFPKGIVSVLSDWEENKSGTQDQIKIQLGNFPEQRTKHKSDRIIYDSSSNSDLLWFPDISLQGELALEEKQLEVAKLQGKLFHEIMEFSTSKTAALNKLNQLEIIKAIPATYKSVLIAYIEAAFDNDQLATILNSGEHLNEQTLVISPFETLRPDKIILCGDEIIVLDFKTGDFKKKDQKQVENYMNYLHEIYNLPVSGYLYYVSKNELVSVNSSI